MKLLKWVRFSWELANVPAEAGEVPAHYTISPASAEDEMALRKVFSTGFLLDPAWNPAISEVMQTIQSRIDAALRTGDRTFLALRHGSRIIGAALLHPDAAADEQFAIGPTVLSEYRNRGFGTLLLAASLRWLHDAGLTRAAAMGPEAVPVTRFLYPKFDSVAVAQSPALAAYRVSSASSGAI